MKKKILLFTLTAGMASIILQSNLSGPANGTGGNRTGAKASTANCSSGGCHGTTAGADARIWIDSAGTPVSQYTAGKTYNVKVVGSHATLSKFGFQFAAVSGTGASQVQAGTFAGIPSSVASHTNSGLTLIEQTTQISKVSPADSFVKSFTWTAPATGVGTITLYLTVNAVDGDGNISAGDGSDNATKTLTLYTPVSVKNIAATASVKAFPNPVADQLNIQVGNAYTNYSIAVFDITGRNILNTTLDANATGSASINTSSWVPGMYKVVVANENSREVISVVKQ